MTVLSSFLCACRPDVAPARVTSTVAEVDRWLDGLEALEVQTAGGQVLQRVTTPSAMRAFLSRLPASEFEDVFGEVGSTEYVVRFRGSKYARFPYHVWFTRTHVRYIPKGAAKLRPGERAEILSTLGVVG